MTRLLSRAAVVAVLGFGVIARAGDAAPEAAGPVSLVRGPYVQDMRPDGFVVVFDTSAPTAAETVVGATRVHTEGTHHEARVTGLQPATRYPYAVQLGAAQPVARAETATAPELGSRRPFTFIVYGDSRDGRDIEAQLLQAAKKEGAEFALHTGDMVRDGFDDQEWQTFFDVEKSWLAEVPVFPAVGNHELHGDLEAKHFTQAFVLPGDGRRLRYYTFRWGPARFIALDGNGRFEEQSKFLEDTLRAAQTTGEKDVFVFLHQPPLSTGRHCGAGMVQAGWVDLFERFRVRAVFAGHDHSYERLERNGVRYFISGGGGAPGYEEREDCGPADIHAKRIYSRDNHYLAVRLAGDELVVTVRRVQPGASPIEVVKDRRAPLTASFGAPPLGAQPSWVWRQMWIWGAVAGGMVLLLVIVALRRRGERA